MAKPTLRPALGRGRTWLARLAGRLARAVPGSERRRAAAAEATAQRLLQDLLGAEAGQLRREGYIELPSRMFAGVVYRLRPRQPVEVVDRGDGQPAGRLCVVVRAGVPAADALLAKALWLRANEPEFLRVARRLA